MKHRCQTGNLEICLNLDKPKFYGCEHQNLLCDSVSAQDWLPGASASMLPFINSGRKPSLFTSFYKNLLITKCFFEFRIFMRVWGQFHREEPYLVPGYCPQGQVFRWLLPGNGESHFLPRQFCIPIHLPWQICLWYVFFHLRRRTGGIAGHLTYSARPGLPVSNASGRYRWSKQKPVISFPF